MENKEFALDENTKSTIINASRKHGWDYVRNRASETYLAVVKKLRSEMLSGNKELCRALRMCTFAPRWFYFIHDESEAVEILKRI